MQNEKVTVKSFIHTILGRKDYNVSYDIFLGTKKFKVGSWNKKGENWFWNDEPCPESVVGNVEWALQTEDILQ